MSRPLCVNIGNELVKADIFAFSDLYKFLIKLIFQGKACIMAFSNNDGYFFHIIFCENYQ